MDRHNQDDSAQHADDGRHPNENTLSESYRTLEGFNLPHNRFIAIPENWKVGNFNRLAVPLSEANLRTVAINMFRIFCILLISSVTLGLIVTLLHQSIKQLANKISLYPIDFVWPPTNP